MTDSAVQTELKCISKEDILDHRTELIAMIQDLIVEKNKVVDLS